MLPLVDEFVQLFICLDDLVVKICYLIMYLPLMCFLLVVRRVQGEAAQSVQLVEDLPGSGQWFLEQ
jgi:hypothetical protein